MKDVPLWMRFVMAVGITSAYVYMLVSAMETPDAMVALVTLGWQWFFGSSKGSADKTQQIIGGDK